MAAARALEVRPASIADAAELAANLREDDKRELAATSATNPADAIRFCIERSERAWTGRVRGDLAFIGGIGAANMLTGWRVPWMLGTPVLDANGLEFLRFCRRNLPEIRAAYPLMTNYVDARSTTTIRWLAWLGFTIHDAEPYGILRRPFHHFTMESNRV